MNGKNECGHIAAQCNICGAHTENVILAKGGHEVRRCSACGLAFTYPIPEQLEAQYDSAYFELYRKRREFRLARADARLKRIETIKKPGRLLDIGCSLGYFVEAACRRGWNAEGLEISPFAAQEARALGLNVRDGVLQSAGYESGVFDCVTMWDVLEHVPDPTGHMREVNRILADGGLVVIGTPDLGHPAFRLKGVRWRHLKPAEHIFYFSRSSIAKTGFEEVYCKPLGVLSGAAALIARHTQLKDVMTVYGVKNGLPIS